MCVCVLGGVVITAYVHLMRKTEEDCVYLYLCALSANGF